MTDRRDLLKRLRNIETNWAYIRAELNQFGTSPVWSICDILRANLARLPRFEKFLLTMLTQYGGELHVIERVRDVAAEERLPDNAPTREIYKDQRRSMGSIRGREFIVGAGSLKSSFEAALEKLVAEVEGLSEVGSDLNTAVLRKRLQRVTFLVKEAKAAINRVRSVRDFAQPEHIRRLCQCAVDWRKHRDSEDKYSFDGRNIVGVEDGGKQVDFPIPSFDIPSTPRLDGFIA